MIHAPVQRSRRADREAAPRQNIEIALPGVIVIGINAYLASYVPLVTLLPPCTTNRLAKKVLRVPLKIVPQSAEGTHAPHGASA
jgi:hypothetical protein